MEITTTATAAEIMTEARKLLAKPNGWCQGNFALHYGGVAEPYSFCPIGAVQHVVNHSWQDYPAYYDVLRAMHQALPHDGIADSGNEPRIIRWNDAPDRTQQDVLDLYDRVLAGLDC